MATIQTVDIVAAAKERLVLRQALPYPPGLTVHPVWRKHQEHMRACLPELRDAETVIWFGQTNTNSGFNHRTLVTPKNLIKQAADLLHRYPDYDIGWNGLCESPLSSPGTVGSLFGTKFSNIFFWHLEAYTACVTRLCPEPKRILEIGGGMGELARLFKLAHPDVHYTIVDLPESLFFAEVYLRAHFPDGDFQFIPVQEIQSLQGIPYDLAINQGSFQEMTASGLEYWLGFLEDSQCRAFYSLNYKETRIILSNQWREVYRETNPPPIFADAPRDWLALGLERRYGIVTDGQGNGAQGS